MRSPSYFMRSLSPHLARVAARGALCACVVACNIATVGGSTDRPVELPDECTQYLSAFSTCLEKASTPHDPIRGARMEQARASLLAEARRAPEQLAQLGTKCSDARARLTSCR